MTKTENSNGTNADFVPCRQSNSITTATAYSLHGHYHRTTYIQCLIHQKDQSITVTTISLITRSPFTTNYCIFVTL